MKCIVCKQPAHHAPDLRSEVDVCDIHHDMLKKAERLHVENIRFIKDNIKYMEDRKKILEEYVECKRIIKENEEKMKSLQDSIKDFSQVDDVFDLDYATVTYQAGKSTYKYSPELTKRAELLKADQKLEVQTDVAIVVAGSPFLVVKFK